MKTKILFIILIILSLFTISNLSGQEAVKIKRITEQIAFDGIPKEEAWQSVDLYPLTMQLIT